MRPRPAAERRLAEVVARLELTLRQQQQQIQTVARQRDDALRAKDEYRDLLVATIQGIDLQICGVRARLAEVVKAEYEARRDQILNKPEARA